MKKLNIHLLNLLNFFGFINKKALERDRESDWFVKEFYKMDQSINIYKVSEIISTTCLTPYINPGHFDIKIRGLHVKQLERQEINNRILHVNIFQNGVKYELAFNMSVNNKDFKNPSFELLYLTDKIIFQYKLFYYVLSCIDKDDIYPNALEKYNNDECKVFIKNIKKKCGYQIQKWIFFNPDYPNKNTSVKVISGFTPQGEPEFFISKDE